MERGIVTPEGVILDFERAGIASRMLARMIDTFILVVALGVLVNLAATLALASSTFALVVVLVLVFALIFLYPMALETAWRGRTVGKYVVGLRVITIEGGPVRLRHSAIRSMMQIIDILITFGGAAVVSALTNAEGQRLGDIAAGTYVVRERRSRSMIADREVDIPTPWGMQPIVDSLDISSLDISQAALIRSFIVRVPELSDDSRVMLATQLADRVSASIETPAPEGLHPETWLACVAARVQQQSETARRSSLPPPPGI